MPFNTATGTQNTSAADTDNHVAIIRRYTRAAVGITLLVAPPFSQAIHHPLDPPPDAVKLLAQASASAASITGIGHAAFACGMPTTFATATAETPAAAIDSKAET
jgi:hypothetical protein